MVNDNIEEVDPSTCIHHWVLPIAEGHISIGVCQKCGTDKGFFNSIKDVKYNGVSKVTETVVEPTLDD